MQYKYIYSHGLSSIQYHQAFNIILNSSFSKPLVIHSQCGLPDTPHPLKLNYNFILDFTFFFKSQNINAIADQYNPFFRKPAPVHHDNIYYELMNGMNVRLEQNLFALYMADVFI